MSRSRKKAIVTLSRKMQDNVHSVVRHRVKQKLGTIDIDDPDELTLLDVEADCRELGMEDYGTKFGVEFWDEADKEDLKRGRRK